MWYVLYVEKNGRTTSKWWYYYGFTLILKDLNVCQTHGVQLQGGQCLSDSSPRIQIHWKEAWSPL